MPFGGAPSGGAGTGGVPPDSGWGGCGGGLGGADCFDKCSGAAFEPYCDGKDWTCGPPAPCVDAGPCQPDQVTTIHGCLSCDDAKQKLLAEIEAARKANASCTTKEDCMMTAATQWCSGLCGVAVSKDWEAAFFAAFAKLAGSYCKDFYAVCGPSDPKCPVPVLACSGGLCEATYP